MKVQIRIQKLAVKPIDRFGVLTGDVAPADVFANHRTVFRFHQPVVIGVTRPRLGLFDQKFVQQAGHGVVDEFAAVVGMKPMDAERELLQHGF